MRTSHLPYIIIIGCKQVIRLLFLLYIIINFFFCQIYGLIWLNELHSPTESFCFCFCYMAREISSHLKKAISVCFCFGCTYELTSKFNKFGNKLLDLFFQKYLKFNTLQHFSDSILFWKGFSYILVLTLNKNH